MVAVRFLIKTKYADLALLPIVKPSAGTRWIVTIYGDSLRAAIQIRGSDPSKSLRLAEVAFFRCRLRTVFEPYELSESPRLGESQLLLFLLWPMHESMQFSSSASL